MPYHRGALKRILPLLILAAGALIARPQSGNAGTLHGAVTDPSGAVIPGATVHVANAVSQFDRTVTTDATGQFTITNLPFNPYRINGSFSQGLCARRRKPSKCDLR